MEQMIWAQTTETFWWQAECDKHRFCLATRQHSCNTANLMRRMRYLTIVLYYSLSIRFNAKRCFALTINFFSLHSELYALVVCFHVHSQEIFTFITFNNNNNNNSYGWDSSQVTSCCLRNRIYTMCNRKTP